MWLENKIYVYSFRIVSWKAQMIHVQVHVQTCPMIFQEVRFSPPTAGLPGWTPASSVLVIMLVLPIVLVRGHVGTDCMAALFLSLHPRAAVGTMQLTCESTMQVQALYHLPYSSACVKDICLKRHTVAFPKPGPRGTLSCMLDMFPCFCSWLQLMTD